MLYKILANLAWEHGLDTVTELLELDNEFIEPFTDEEIIELKSVIEEIENIPWIV